MAEIKTKVNNASVKDFLNSIEDEQKKSDSFELLNIYEEITGEKAKMWGTSIVGFGQYHYKSERSTQEGDWPLAGFSPRKQSLTLYMMRVADNLDELISKLGKNKISGGCLYIKRLSDVDMKVLKEIIKKAFLEAKKKLT